MNKNNNKILDVYLYNNFAGKLFFKNGLLSFQYDQQYLNSKSPKALSYSIPLSNKQYDHKITESFFSGLLPEENIRRQIAKYLHISYQNTFALLDAIGGECAGAISVYKEDYNINQNINKYNYKILTDNEASDILLHLDKIPMYIDKDDVRISGAGAQDKLIISLVDNKIAIPLKGTPSSYILKPEIKGFQYTVENEFFCMQLAKNIGLPVPDTFIYTLKDKNFYLVKRYDRQHLNDGIILRLHQEDFCQALHIAPIQKYENEGGPSLKQCFELLDQKIKLGLMSGDNKFTLLKGIIFNFLIGNGDAHGKNFSILYDKDKDKESLAPFYDLLSTRVYTNSQKSKMAMKLGNKYKFKDVTLKQFEYLSDDIGFRFDFVKKQIKNAIENINKEAVILIEKLNKDQKYSCDIYNSIFEIIKENSAKLIIKN